MHASSLENMWRCYRRYVADGPLEAQDETTVIDLSEPTLGRNFREIFDRPPFKYLAFSSNLDAPTGVIRTDPYKLPFSDQSVDLVLCNRTFVHFEFFWLMFSNMVKIMNSAGYIFLIAPSSGSFQSGSADRYRLCPDSYAALAKYADCSLVETWLDDRGPWYNAVGVFRAHGAPNVSRPISLTSRVSPIWAGPNGSEEEETTRGSVLYLDILQRLHVKLEPKQYLEIGVRHGTSLFLASGPAIGVDPNPDIHGELPETTQIMQMTSDDFFEEKFKIFPDLCFIDGLHLFEQVLRDFMNIERVAAPGSLVVIDDIFPNHPAQTERERRTRVWTGDVWRIAEVLRQRRPDLFLLALDAAPAGLLLVAGLDNGNRLLWDGYDTIVSEAQEQIGPPQSVIERQGAFAPAGDLVTAVLEVLKGARAARCAPTEVVARLRLAQERLVTRRTAFAPHRPRLSVVIISYNMARELPRTVRSLSPAMQHDIDPRDYEVIVVDNGSALPLNEEQLRQILPGLRIYRMQYPTQSPVPAINFGLAQARGDLVGVCIDGARMVSPGLLSKALAASKLHQRPVIGTLSFHLGPKVQMESVQEGYDQRIEDELLAASGWEADGYRLFSISVFASSSVCGWFGLPDECNALFLRAEHWRALGGWDEEFVSPGGGLANHDTWLRACSDPTGEVIMLLGEATFHQVHGGIATNNPDAPHALFNEEYRRLRGCEYKRPEHQPLHFGTISQYIRDSMK